MTFPSTGRIGSGAMLHAGRLGHVAYVWRPVDADGVRRDGLLMSLEGTTARCEQQASHMLIHGRPLDPKELVAHIDAVDEDAVVRVAKRIIAGTPTLAALGPVGKIEELGLFSERLRS